MRTGNVLILATCGVLVLADWSQPGRFRFGFPFVSESVRVAQQVPAAFAKGRDAALAELGDAEELLRYEGPVVAKPVQDSCGDPVPPTYAGVTKQQIAGFVASKPIDRQTLEETAQQLGQPFCQVDPYTLRWTEQGSTNSLQVTFQQQGDRPQVVVGYQYDDKSAPPANVTSL